MLKHDDRAGAFHGLRVARSFTVITIVIQGFMAREVLVLEQRRADFLDTSNAENETVVRPEWTSIARARGAEFLISHCFTSPNLSASNVAICFFRLPAVNAYLVTYTLLDHSVWRLVHFHTLPPFR